MKKFFPYFEANNTRYTILRGMRIFLSQSNQVLAVQSANKVFSKPTQDPLLVRFWQNEIAREYGI